MFLLKWTYPQVVKHGLEKYHIDRWFSSLSWSWSHRCGRSKCLVSRSLNFGPKTAAEYHILIKIVTLYDAIVHYNIYSIQYSIIVTHCKQSCWDSNQNISTNRHTAGAGIPPQNVEIWGTFEATSWEYQAWTENTTEINIMRMDIISDIITINKIQPQHWIRMHCIKRRIKNVRCLLWDGSYSHRSVYWAADKLYCPKHRRYCTCQCIGTTRRNHGLRWSSPPHGLIFEGKSPPEVPWFLTQMAEVSCRCSLQTIPVSCILTKNTEICGIRGWVKIPSKCCYKWKHQIGSCHSWAMVSGVWSPIPWSESLFIYIYIYIIDIFIHIYI